MSTKVALITGSSRGIGRSIALALASLQWNVIVNYATNAPAAQQVVSAIQTAGGSALVVQADISLSKDRHRLVDQTLSAFGRIDLLVNNAGIAPATRADILDASEESFDAVLAVNLKGPYFLTQRVAKEMLRHLQTSKSLPSDDYHPAIITISSISAYTASTTRGDYCISKAGLAMLTALFAARLASDGINVYEIRPGIIDTDMTRPVKDRYDKLLADGLTPLPRWGQPDDVAKAVTAIAQGLLPFSTGEILNIDGGFHLHRL